MGDHYALASTLSRVRLGRRRRRRATGRAEASRGRRQVRTAVCVGERDRDLDLAAPLGCARSASPALAAVEVVASQVRPRPATGRAFGAHVEVGQARQFHGAERTVARRFDAAGEFRTRERIEVCRGTPADRGLVGTSASFRQGPAIRSAAADGPLVGCRSCDAAVRATGLSRRGCSSALRCFLQLRCRGRSVVWRERRCGSSTAPTARSRCSPAACVAA